MSLYRSYSFLSAIKCEMCPRLVTNRVFGLCERCVIIWTNKRGLENMNITIELVKATIVRMSQNKTHFLDMDVTFRRAIEDDRRRRKLKFDLIQKIREKFQSEIILREKMTYYYIRYETEEDYFNIDISHMDINDLLLDTRLPYPNDI